MESNERLFYYQGSTEITDSRDATRAAFKVDLINRGEVWMDMIVSRNKTSHTYNEGTAIEIAENIVNDYIFLFNTFGEKMTELKDRVTDKIF